MRGLGCAAIVGTEQDGVEVWDRQQIDGDDIVLAQIYQNLKLHNSRRVIMN